MPMEGEGRGPIEVGRGWGGGGDAPRVGVLMESCGPPGRSSLLVERGGGSMAAFEPVRQSLAARAPGLIFG